MTRITKLAACTFGIMVPLLLLIGCTQSTATPTATTPTSLTVTQVISKASDKFDTVNSFHFALNQSGGGTPIGMGLVMMKVDGDIVRPDKLKATITGMVSGMSMGVQMISSGGVTYMTNPLSGSWEQLPSEFAVLSVFNPNNGVTSVMKGMTGFTKLSDEQSAGVVCYHISGSIDSEKLSPITGSSVKGTTIGVELWVGKDDFLIRSIKLTGKITETEVTGIIRTLDISAFDETISITLPK
jgi:lipoprotein LprG